MPYHMYSVSTTPAAANPIRDAAPAVAPTMDPRDTYLEMATRGTPTAVAIRPAQGVNMNRPPHPVAMPAASPEACEYREVVASQGGQPGRGVNARGRVEGEFGHGDGDDGLGHVQQKYNGSDLPAGGANHVGHAGLAAAEVAHVDPAGHPGGDEPERHGADQVADHDEYDIFDCGQRSPLPRKRILSGAPSKPYAFRMAFSRYRR